MSFASDTFTGTDGTLLSTYNAAWSLQFGHTVGSYINSNAATGGLIAGGAYCIYQNSGAPANADYSVFADITNVDDTVGWQAGITGRNAALADTCYLTASINVSGTSDTQRVYRLVAGAYTQIGSNSTVSFAGTTSHELRMAGDQISMYLGGVAKCGSPITDANITAAGKAGILLFNNSAASVTVSIDNWSGVDAAAGGGAGPLIGGSLLEGGALIRGRLLR